MLFLVNIAESKLKFSACGKIFISDTCLDWALWKIKFFSISMIFIANFLYIYLFLFCEDREGI